MKTHKKEFLPKVRPGNSSVQLLFFSLWLGTKVGVGFGTRMYSPGKAKKKNRPNEHMCVCANVKAMRDSTANAGAVAAVDDDD